MNKDGENAALYCLLDKSINNVQVPERLESADHVIIDSEDAALYCLFDKSINNVQVPEGLESADHVIQETEDAGDNIMKDIENTRSEVVFFISKPA